MKKILIVLYIMFVAALSVTARAQSVDLVITESEVDASTQVIKLMGHFPTPCVGSTSVKAEIVAPKVISLSIAGQSTAEICIQIVGSPMAVAVDAANIKFELGRKGIELDGTYKVILPQAKLETEFSFDSLMGRPFSSRTITGRVMKANGDLVIVSGDQVLQIVSPFIDLANHFDQIVEVSGHVDGRYAVGTDVFRTNAKPSETMFIVTGLRLVARN